MSFNFIYVILFGVILFYFSAFQFIFLFNFISIYDIHLI